MMVMMIVVVVVPMPDDDRAMMVMVVMMVLHGHELRICIGGVGLPVDRLQNGARIRNGLQQVSVGGRLKRFGRRRQRRGLC